MPTGRTSRVLIVKIILIMKSGRNCSKSSTYKMV